MNTEVFSDHPWASSTSCSPVRKEKKGASNCKTSMTSSCYKMIPVPRKFKPFDQLAMKCYEAEVRASIGIGNAVCPKQQYFRNGLQMCPSSSQH